MQRKEFKDLAREIYLCKCFKSDLPAHSLVTSSERPDDYLFAKNFRQITELNPNIFLFRWKECETSGRIRITQKILIYPLTKYIYC